jgi:small subunit ribosomal protein S5
MGRGEVTREVATKVFLRAQALAEQSPEGLEGMAGMMQEWEHAASQEEKADPLRPADRTLEMHVVNINRTVKVTKSGSLQRFTALVVVGNRAGAVGWALGKAPEVPAAVDKAYTRAARHLFYFPRYQEHTIFHGARAKFGATHVTIDPLPSGMGLKANTTARPCAARCVEGPTDAAFACADPSGVPPGWHPRHPRQGGGQPQPAHHAARCV